MTENVFEQTAPVQTPDARPSHSRFKIKIHPKIKIIFLVLLLILIVIGGFIFVFGYLPGKKVYNQALLLISKQSQIQQLVQSKNLDTIETELKQVKTDIATIQADYQALKVIGSLPLVKNYYQDGKLALEIAQQGLDTGQIIIEAIKPYQDFLGLAGQATNSADTAQDRIDFVTQSVEGILPHLDKIDQNLVSIQTKLSQIDVNRYPDEFRQIKIKSNLVKLSTSLDSVHQIIKDGRPLLNNISWFLGKDAPRRYFLLFQNDAELRPSGGFWTAYGILKVDNGKITPLISDDIYSLDDKFKSTLPAPRPIKEYHINIPYWYLRDMNLSADFPTNAQTFLQYYQKISSEKFDAIIAIDTNVLVDLVTVLGRIGVPGYGNFSAEPDKRCYGCPQIIYELEYIAGKPRSFIVDNRKGFLAPLMHSILSNAMGAPKDKIAPLAETFFKNIHQKHILFYFLDEKLQQAANLANITGYIQQTSDQVDYFHLNDANMASAKTNLFIEQKIKHQIITTADKIEHKITISYTNPYQASNCNLEKGDLCLNAPKYRHWFRFYTPINSQLVKMTGSEIQPVEYQENGKQVFEGFYGDKYPLYAKSSNLVSIQYVSGIKPLSSYQLLLQKQPGTKPVTYQLLHNGQVVEEFVWSADKLIKLAL